MQVLSSKMPRLHKSASSVWPISGLDVQLRIQAAIGTSEQLQRVRYFCASVVHSEKKMGKMLTFGRVGKLTLCQEMLTTPKSYANTGEWLDGPCLA